MAMAESCKIAVSTENGRHGLAENQVSGGPSQLQGTLGPGLGHHLVTIGSTYEPVGCLEAPIRPPLLVLIPPK